jgi:hypothetical protein
MGGGTSPACVFNGRPTVFGFANIHGTELVVIMKQNLSLALSALAGAGVVYFLATQPGTPGLSCEGTAQRLAISTTPDQGTKWVYWSNANNCDAIGQLATALV